MTYTPPDFMDDISRALRVHLDTDDVRVVGEAALREINRLQQLDEAQELAEANGGLWGEHHTHLPADWRLEVENHDTRLGYWEWVRSKLSHEEIDPLLSEGRTTKPLPHP